MLKKSSLINQEKGFSLYEVLFAIALITTTVYAAVVLIGSSIQQNSREKDRLIALHLAQEGIELVRNIRDTAWVDATIAWDDVFGIGGADLGNNNMIDYLSSSIITGGGCNQDANVLKINASGFYNHTAGTDTKFKRCIAVSQNNLPGGPANTYYKVTSQVKWDNRDVKIVHQLHDWLQ